MRTTEEILAVNPYFTYVKTDRNGTRYFEDRACPRCGGRGIITHYRHVDHGTCFACGGSGIAAKPRTVKYYTPEHEEELRVAREKRAEAKRNARKEEFKANLNEKIEALGFSNENGVEVCYRVVGDTYSIKEQLKALGCRYNPCLGWYSAKDLDNYYTQRIEANSVIHFDEEAIALVWEDANEVKKMWTENLEIPDTAWVGEVGSRITVELHVDRVFESSFYVHPGERGQRTSYMLLMHDEDGNIYKWSTSSFHQEGEDLKLRATVKEHSEYKGRKQTVITRGTVVE